MTTVNAQPGFNLQTTGKQSDNGGPAANISHIDADGNLYAVVQKKTASSFHSDPASPRKGILKNGNDVAYVNMAYQNDVTDEHHGRRTSVGHERRNYSDDEDVETINPIYDASFTEEQTQM